MQPLTVNLETRNPRLDYSPGNSSKHNCQDQCNWKRAKSVSRSYSFAAPLAVQPPWPLSTSWTLGLYLVQTLSWVWPFPTLWMIPTPALVFCSLSWVTAVAHWSLFPSLRMHKDFMILMQPMFSTSVLPPAFWLQGAWIWFLAETKPIIILSHTTTMELWSFWTLIHPLGSLWETQVLSCYPTFRLTLIVP